jgi:hypothetical protein
MPRHWLRNRKTPAPADSRRASASRAQAEVNIVADRLRTLHDPRSGRGQTCDDDRLAGFAVPLPLKLAAACN